MDKRALVMSACGLAVTLLMGCSAGDGSGWGEPAAATTQAVAAPESFPHCEDGVRTDLIVLPTTPATNTAPYHTLYSNGILRPASCAPGDTVCKYNQASFDTTKQLNLFRYLVEFVITEKPGAKFFAQGVANWNKSPLKYPADFPSFTKLTVHPTQEDHPAFGADRRGEDWLAIRTLDANPSYVPPPVEAKTATCAYFWVGKYDASTQTWKQSDQLIDFIPLVLVYDPVGQPW